MRFFIKLLLILTALACLCSCSNKEDVEMKLEISPPDQFIKDLVSQVYSDSQLYDIYQKRGSVKELNMCYPIECLRTYGSYFRASYLGENRIAVVVFDQKDTILITRLYNISIEKKAFDKLEIGQSLQDVMQTDPDGDYLFLYTGRNDLPKISSHYTKDGYLVSIKYDESDKITEIDIELI